MNKTILITILLIILIASCNSSTDDSKTTVDTTEQKPLFQLSKLDSTKLKVTGTTINNTPYEFGPRLKFLKDGSITGFGILMPDAGQYRVTIWNLVDTSIVKTDSIVVDSGKIKYKNFTNIQVKANDEYSITVQSSDWYIYEDINNRANFLPKTIQDIQIINYGNRVGSSQEFPSTTFTDFLAGLQDIIFKAK